MAMVDTYFEGQRKATLIGHRPAGSTGFRDGTQGCKLTDKPCSGKLVADYPFQPFILAADSKDNILAVFRYDPQPGYLAGGKQETIKRLPDDNPAYSSYGNSGWAAYPASFDPDNPDETFRPMIRKAT